MSALQAFKARRSVLYVPASNARALEKARSLAADAVILDLEDAVAPLEKAAARAAACAAVSGLRPRETIIRVNAADSPWGIQDLAAAVAAQPDAILLPKVQDAEDIFCARSRTGALPLWAMIETPRAVLNAGEIAAAGVQCLVLGGNDLLKAMGARHMPRRDNLQTAMLLCVLAARSQAIAVLDGVHNAMTDTDGFARACNQARDFGFDGKTLVHPDQIAPANAAFSPCAQEIEAAQRVVAAFAKEPTAGVISLEGRMLERLDLDIAQDILVRAGIESA